MAFIAMWLLHGQSNPTIKVYMIKQSLLDALEGLPVDVAEEMVKAAKHQVEIVPEDAMAITLQARPNTIILWQENGLVSLAQAGDPLETDEDV
jgi:hypothetical protein